MPTVCCDTSFLISLYGNDVNTTLARLEVARLATPVIVTKLNEFEMLNAVRLAISRRVISVADANQVISAFSNDLAIGKLAAPTYDLEVVFAEANRISAVRTATGGYRSFDILHVAAALYLGADIFLSFDAKQRTLAAAEGLTVRP